MAAPEEGTCMTIQVFQAMENLGSKVMANAQGSNIMTKFSQAMEEFGSTVLATPSLAQDIFGNLWSNQEQVITELNDKLAQLQEEQAKDRETIAQLERQQEDKDRTIKLMNVKLILLENKLKVVEEATVRLKKKQLKKANDKLWEASRRGDVDKIKSALDKGADVNCKLDKGLIKDFDYEDCSPLHVASGLGHYEAVEYLLSQGSEVNSKDSEGWTPLHIASYEGHDKVIPLLLDNGADLDAAVFDDETALHWASIRGKFKCLRILLERGADTSLKDKWGQTAFQVAGKDNYANADGVRIVFRQFGIEQ